jgi:cell division septation protein DedD
LLGNDAEKFGQLITTQIQKSGGGILNTVKRFLSGGGTDNPTQIMQQFGLDANQLTNELLALTPQQMTSFIQQTSGIQPFKFSAPASEQPNGTKPAEQTISAAGTQNTASSQPTQETKPAQASTTTTGASEKPTPDKAQQRDVAIQRAVKNRNAFNTQQLSALSNEEVANDLKAIANSLGIKL